MRATWRRWRARYLLLAWAMLAFTSSSWAGEDFLGDLDPSTTTVERKEDKLYVRTKNANGKIQEKIYRLELVSPDTSFTHWTTEKKADALSSAGKLSKKDWDFFSTYTGKLQEYGPGFYVSSDPFDSAAFGEASIAIEHSEPFWALKIPVKTTSTESTRKVFALLREQGVLGTKVTDTWYTLFDERAAEKVSLQDWKAMIPQAVERELAKPPRSGGFLYAGNHNYQAALRHWRDNHSLNDEHILNLANDMNPLSKPLLKVELPKIIEKSPDDRPIAYFALAQMERGTKRMQEPLNKMGESLATAPVEKAQLLLARMQKSFLLSRFPELGITIPSEATLAFLHAAEEDEDLNKFVVLDLLPVTRKPSVELVRKLMEIRNFNSWVFNLALSSLSKMDLSSPGVREELVAGITAFAKSRPDINSKWRREMFGAVLKKAGVSFENWEKDLDAAAPCDKNFAKVR